MFMQVSGCYPLGCSSFSRTLRLASTSAGSAAACAASSRCLRVAYSGPVSQVLGGATGDSTPGLEVRRFRHGKRRRKARKEVTVVLTIGHTLRAHEALSRPYALSGFLEFDHRLFEYGVFVGHDQSIRTGWSS